LLSKFFEGKIPSESIVGPSVDLHRPFGGAAKEVEIKRLTG